VNSARQATRWSLNHSASRSKESVIGASAMASRAHDAASGAAPATARVKTVPWIAATTFHQQRGGACSRSHGTTNRHGERVAGCTDHQHPRADRSCDVRTQDEHQKCIAFPVEPRIGRRRGARAPRDPVVDRVAQQRSHRERHQGRYGRMLEERVRDQRRRTAGEGGPGERHEVGRPHRIGTSPGQTSSHRRTSDNAACQSDTPGGGTVSDGRPEGSEQGDRGSRPGRFQSRSRVSLICAYRSTTRIATVWFTGGAEAS
jgi:hypothetical protein